MVKRFRSLSARSQFLHLKAHGHSFHVNSWLLANVEKTQTEVVRCGWTIPRQIGPAVLRNRFRRWGREYLRKWSAENKHSLDLNLIFKRKEPGFYKSVSHKDFDGAMEKLVVKLPRYLE
ncbi:MAG: ribonuclease P protein component [Bdellovibrionales bacterium]